MALVVTLTDDNGFKVTEAGAVIGQETNITITQGQIAKMLLNPAYVAACTPAVLAELRRRAAAYRPPL